MAQRTPHRLYQHVRATNGAPAQEAGQPSATDTKDQVNVRGIEIAGWTVESSRGSIANAAEMDMYVGHALFLSVLRALVVQSKH